jgi:Tfp pilus assembly protein PilN
MPQQINLHRPAPRAPRQPLAPRAMALLLSGWTVALLLLCGWTLWRSQALEADAAAAEAQHAAERGRLQQLLAQRPEAANPAALEQQLATLEANIAQRSEMLARLGGLGEASPLPLMQQLARELPPPVWLSNIRWSPATLSLAGQTLDPEALPAWAASLGPQATLNVERAAGEAGRWSFRIARGAAAAGARP